MLLIRGKLMIISAACRATVNGEKNVFPVHRHCDFFRWMKLLHCDYKQSEVEQGFIAYDPVSRKEQFMNRAEAYIHARECGQIPWKESITELYSEDLY